VAVPAKVSELFTTANLIGSSPWRRIGRYASNSTFTKDAICELRAPTGMSWLTRDRHIEALAQFTKEMFRNFCREDQLRWKLHEHYTELTAQSFNFRSKLIEYLWQRREFAAMRQGSWRLHCEAKIFRNTFRPTTVSVNAMMAIERAVYFYGVQSLRVTLQVRAIIGE
jgi:hypothetical protein